VLDLDLERNALAELVKSEMKDDVEFARRCWRSRRREEGSSSTHNFASSREDGAGSLLSRMNREHCGLQVGLEALSV
jgi:hypothetical protein